MSIRRRIFDVIQCCIRKSAFIIVIHLLLIAKPLSGQVLRLEYERWGEIGVGKLVTRMSNTNNIASARLKAQELSKFPAFEFPYNPNREGLHINYGTQISFHVAGVSSDKGPRYTYDPNTVANPLVESGDQEDYKYYKGFHFEGFPNYSPPASTDPNANLVPVSTDNVSWPSGGWPATYPTSDPVLDDYYPTYPTVYANPGFITPIPLPLDTLLGFPGAGPNRHSAPGRYYPGQVVADQESFTVSFAKSRANDESSGHLMIYTTLRGLSWRGDVAEDFLFWILTVTNIGTAPIDSTYIGMFADFDFPWASYDEYHSYSKTDAFALDTYMLDEGTGKEEQIAYGWDGDGYIAGAVRGDLTQRRARNTDESILRDVALAGVIFLQTPQDTMTGVDLGITTWDAFNKSLRDDIAGIGNDANRFYWMNIRNAGIYGPGRDPDDLDNDKIDDWTWTNPYPLGAAETYEDGYHGAMTVNTGPFRLDPGETDTLICATIMGMSRSELFKNAKMARRIFRQGWNVPKGPFEPRLVTETGNNRIALRWGTLSENDSLNAAFGRQSFEGYKIYRSDDGGMTWGELPITDENGTVVDYVPAAQYDLANSIIGASPILPYFNRGSDSGLDDILAPTDSLYDIYLGELGKTITDTLRHVYIDTNVVNGFTYRYAVLAYSAGDIDPDGLPPLQSSRTSGPNVVTLIPYAPVTRTKSGLDSVKVVPNPYRVINPQETAYRERMIKFTHLPPVCSIRIYNVAGELIATLRHDTGSPIASEEEWNLRSSENREVAPGLYFYFLDSDLGTTAGKFVLIK